MEEKKLEKNIDKKKLVALGLLVFCLSLLVITPKAHAIPVAVTLFLNPLAEIITNGLMSVETLMMQQITGSHLLTAPFDALLGDASTGQYTLYSFIHDIWQTAILPIGCGVLSFVFTIKLIQISQRMDGNASFPAVKEVIFLLVFFAVFLFILQNSFEIMGAIYEVASKAIQTTTNIITSPEVANQTWVDLPTSLFGDPMQAVAICFIAIFSFIACLVAYVLALISVWARGLQIYIMAMCSPIPLALMGTDETKQIGIGYLKAFFAACLAGLILAVILFAYPIMISSLYSLIKGVGDNILVPLQSLVVNCLLIYGLVKSGSWAQAIMGG